MTEKTVLIVEDSPTQALHLRTLLEDAGLTVFVADNGETGIDYARRNHPRAIVLDLEMPGMNGLQVCMQLKKDRTTALIPVILLTHLDATEMVFRGLQIGAVEYIPKDAFADAVLLESFRQMGLIAA